MIFTRKHPYLCFIVAIIIAGLKFWFNWTAGADVSRKKKMQASSFGILPLDDGTPEDAPMVDAWKRLETWGGWGKLAHDLTNLTIEWVRRWCPYATKFLASFIVFGYLALIIALVLR